ncbi:Alpha/Beta hydrolase protein [Lasiosphaeris hirsuta]|uniref:Alpha/Beta hydrolase protein n=1 Tax=Lasiosphaeris hirsuta TaxID=260670 RepID=A0AA40A3S7_9PEZI|nr:Alpha/Beta hydrolase protein [Lasiosphaeris hirsuta]
MADEGGELRTLQLPTDGYQTVDIVAVHGLNGHYMNSWTAKSKTGKTTMWLKDLLPEKLPGAHIMTFEYDATAAAGASPHGVRENAVKLIRALRDKREDNKDQRRPIVFVGHSLGGIVIKQALRASTNDKSHADVKEISECTKGIVFFGTPHRGSDDAKWATLITGIISTTIGRPPSEFLQTLQTNSEGLMKISEDFRPIAKNYAIASFYEEHVHRVLGHLIVEKTSAVMGLPHEETMMLGGTHSSMCKFARNDKRFDPVWRAIRRAAKGRDRM